MNKFSTLLLPAILLLTISCGGGGGGGGGPSESSSDTAIETPEVTDISGQYEFNAAEGKRFLYLSHFGHAVYSSVAVAGDGVIDNPDEETLSYNYCFGPYTITPDEQADELVLELNCNSWRKPTNTIERFKATFELSIMEYVDVTVVAFDVTEANTNLETIGFLEPTYGDTYAFIESDGKVTNTNVSRTSDLTTEALLPGHYWAPYHAQEFNSAVVLRVGRESQTSDDGDIYYTPSIESVQLEEMGVPINPSVDMNWCDMLGSVTPYTENGDGRQSIVILDAMIQISSCKRPSSIIPADPTQPATTKALKYEMWSSDLEQASAPAMLYTADAPLNGPRVHNLVVAGAQQSDGMSLGMLQLENLCDPRTPEVPPEFKALFKATLSAQDEFTCTDGTTTDGFKFLDHPSPPVISSAEVCEVAERGVDGAATSLACIIEVTDSDNQGSVKVAIQGADAPYFIISKSNILGEWNLSFSSPPDYEVQTSYEIVIIASDGVFSVSKPLFITLNDVLDDLAPQITSENLVRVFENESTISIPTATDEDTENLSDLRWDVISASECTFANCVDGDEVLMRKDSNGVWVLRWVNDEGKDFETSPKTTYNVTIRVSDIHGNQDSQDMEITLVDVEGE